MGADIERESIDPKSNFISRCLHHQGSVLLSSDLNEHGAIFQYYLRQFIIDYVGESWSVAGGFKISLDNKKLKIAHGNFYIDGILCRNIEDCLYESGNIKSDKLQPYAPAPELANNNDELTDLISSDFIVYLECWERHVNSIQRPEIKEIALGGPDASSRMEIVWQVRVLTNNLFGEYAENIRIALGLRKKPDAFKENKISFKDLINGDDDKIKETWQSILDVFDITSPTLRAWARKPSDANEPCSISADSQYRGFENQLYRVEIHTPGVLDNDNVPTFKWSRENASITFKILPQSVTYSNEGEFGKIALAIEKLGPDRRYGLCVGDWVELTNDAIEFGQQVLPLARITNIDANLGDLVLSIEEIATPKFLTDCTMLRRWDQNSLINDINVTGTIDIKESSENDYDKGDWILLEHGIKVQFQPGGNYRHGDYWLIPARVSSGDIEWPKEKINGGFPIKRNTDGIKRHRAILGMHKQGDKNIKNLLNER